MRNALCGPGALGQAPMKASTSTHYSTCPHARGAVPAARFFCFEKGFPSLAAVPKIEWGCGGLQNHIGCDRSKQVVIVWPYIATSMCIYTYIHIKILVASSDPGRKPAGEQLGRYLHVLSECPQDP